MKDARESVDLIVAARYIVPVRPNPAAVLHHHSLVVHNGNIVAILPHRDAEARYKPTKFVTLAFIFHATLVKNVVLLMSER